MSDAQPLKLAGFDGVLIGAGKPGNVSKRLREIYIEESRNRAI